MKRWLVIVAALLVAAAGTPRAQPPSPMDSRAAEVRDGVDTLIAMAKQSDETAAEANRRLEAVRAAVGGNAPAEMPQSGAAKLPQNIPAATARATSGQSRAASDADQIHPKTRSDGRESGQNAAKNGRAESPSQIRLGLLAGRGRADPVAAARHRHADAARYWLGGVGAAQAHRHRRAPERRGRSQQCREKLHRRDGTKRRGTRRPTSTQRRHVLRGNARWRGSRAARRELDRHCREGGGTDGPAIAGPQGGERSCSRPHPSPHPQPRPSLQNRSNPR